MNTANTLSEDQHIITADDLKSLPAITEAPDAMMLDFLKMHTVYLRFAEMYGFTPDEITRLTLNQMQNALVMKYIETKLGKVEINDTEEYYKFLEYLDIYRIFISYDEEVQLLELFPSMEMIHEQMYENMH